MQAYCKWGKLCLAHEVPTTKLAEEGNFAFYFAKIFAKSSQLELSFGFLFFLLLVKQLHGTFTKLTVQEKTYSKLTLRKKKKNRGK